jgi:hypothetical protein
MQQLSSLNPRFSNEKIKVRKLHRGAYSPGTFGQYPDEHNSVFINGEGFPLAEVDRNEQAWKQMIMLMALKWYPKSSPYTREAGDGSISKRCEAAAKALERKAVAS